MRRNFELIVFSAVMVLGLTALTTSASSGEHPMEHPAADSHNDSKVTKEALAKAITGYVDQDSKLHGGYFLIYDAKDKKALALKLVKVHKDRLSQVGTMTYFACADFENTDSRVYDLDVFMKGEDTDHLKVTEISVHKKAGKARYTWQKKDDVWFKVDADTKARLVLASNAEFKISGMKCQECADKICSIIKKIPGVKDAEVDFDTVTARVTWKTAAVNKKVVAAVEEAGFTAVSK